MQLKIQQVIIAYNVLNFVFQNFIFLYYNNINITSFHIFY